GGGAYRVRILNNEDDPGGSLMDTDQILLLQSTGLLGIYKKTVLYFLQANMVSFSPFARAPLVAEKKMKIGKECLITAIDSALTKTILEQIMDGDYLYRGNLYSQGKITVATGNTIQGDILSSAKAEEGAVDIDKNVEVSGNIFTEAGDIFLQEGVSISGKIATNQGTVINGTEGSVQEEQILEEVPTQISPLPLMDYENLYDKLRESQNGGSLTEIPSPSPPESAQVPFTNIFSDVTYSGGSRALGSVGTSTLYYFDSLNMKNGATLNLLGEVTIIVKNKFDINNPNTRIISTGNVTFIVGKYEQHDGTSLQVTGNFNLQASHSEEGDICINGTTTISGNASIIAEDKMEFASKSVLSIGGDATVAAMEDEVRLSGSATFNGNTTIDAGEGVRFKADSSGQGAEGTYTFNGNLTVDALNDVKIENKTTLTLNGTENYFFVKDLFSIESKATLSQLSPAKFLAYVWGENSNIVLEMEPNSNPLGITLFSPKGKLLFKKSTVEPENQKTFIGAFVAQEIELQDSFRIIYDKNLDHFGPTITFFMGYTIVAYKD
ncbi:MAG: hypothetical protein AABZ60_03955, partial [Planctomycetota bacterium]